MLIITKESVNNLKDKLQNIENRDGCKSELKKMLEIKRALFWRADCAQGCCNIGWELPAELASEVQALEDTLGLVEKNRIAEAVSALEDYMAHMD